MNTTRLAATLAVAALAAAACTSSDGPTSTDTTPTADAATSTAPGPSTSSVETSSSTTDAPLTASFRGVTEDTIELGVHFIDLETVFDIVMLDHGDYQAAYEAVIDSYNQAGGVLGRRIEPVFEAINPIGTDPATEACIRLTEDEQVFAVVGQFIDDTVLCYVEQHDTALIGGDITTERMARATSPWFTSTASPERLNTTIVQAFIDGGEFDGATVGVVGTQLDQSAVEQTVLPTLADGGVEVIDRAFFEETQGDEVAGDAAVAVVAERFEAAGIDTVVAVDDAVIQLLAGLEDVQYRPRIVATSLPNTRVFIRDAGRRDLSVLEGAVAGSPAEQLEWWDDPAIQECVDLVEAANPGTTIIDPNDRAESEPEDIVSVYWACHTIALFVTIATAAGPDLTNETFEAAGESLGTIELPGVGTASFGPDKHDGADDVYLFEWDDDAQDLLSDGVPL